MIWFPGFPLRLGWAVLTFPKGPQYRPFLLPPSNRHALVSCAAGDNGTRGREASLTPPLRRRWTYTDALPALPVPRLRAAQGWPVIVTVTSREDGSRLVRFIRFFCHRSIFNLDACLECIFIPSYLMLQSFTDLSAWTAAPFLIRRRVSSTWASRSIIRISIYDNSWIELSDHSFLPSSC